MEFELEYKSTIKSKSFLFKEIKKAAELLYKGFKEFEIKDKAKNDNIFQVNTEARRSEIASIVLQRLKAIDDFFIENSYVTMMVTPAGIKTYYQCWLNPLRYVGKKRGVISPLTAIMRVITEAKTEHPVEITRIQQGYYSKLYNADRWQAAPVWRIQLGDVDTYYVNAYTGEMEQ